MSVRDSRESESSRNEVPESTTDQSSISLISYSQEYGSHGLPVLGLNAVRICDVVGSFYVGLSYLE